MTSSGRAPDFTTVTEIAGTRVRREAVEMLHCRYGFAASLVAGRRVLEVACGAGVGLGILQRTASLVVGGDISAPLLATARRHYGRRARLVRLDAERLPFADAAFDVVVCFEAIYYVSDPNRFIGECARVLDRAGAILLNSVNPEWSEFNPSPHSTAYLSAAGLRVLLERHGFDARVLGAFEAAPATLRDRVVSALKRIAVALHLIPPTMKGKEWLKRLFFGRLEEFPFEILDVPAAVPRPVPLRPEDARRYKVVFAHAVDRRAP